MKKPGPKPLHDLFEKYKKNLKAPEASVVKEVVVVIEELLEISIDSSFFTYTPHSRTLVIKKGGPLRSEILLHKNEVIAHLKGRLGEKNAPTEIL